MVKFFNNIRKNLLKKGKTTNYLKYAFGEIVLVVIGILIALSINHWNSNRIDRNREAVYLKNINRDLKEQLKSIKAQMDYEYSIIKLAMPLIITYKENHEFKVDSAFTAAIGRLTGRMTFVKNNPTYIELLSSGNIDIIRNDSLKNELINYYQQLERMEQVINKNNNLFTDAVFIPTMLQNSEVQLSSVYYTDLAEEMFPGIPDEISNSLIDLNEDNLKAVTRSELQVPEKQLLVINAINFRYQLSVIHYTFLFRQQKRTQGLIDFTESL